MGRGQILTSDSIKKIYRNNMRTLQGLNVWDKSYGAIGMYEKAGESALEYDYNKAIGDAYAAAHSERNLVAESGLGKGFKDALYADIDENLMDAYSQYQQNYAKNAQAIAETANKYRESVSQDLEKTAQNTLKLSDSVYDYLKYLRDYYSTYGGVDKFTSEGADVDMRWNKFMTPEYNDKGEQTGTRLKTKEELQDMLYDEEEYIDEYGNKQSRYVLNQAGVDYYDQVMNWPGEGDKNSPELNYEAWLYEQSQNEKGDYAGLYDWYKSYNPYADALANPTNAGLARTAFGMISTDYAYTFAERFGGLSEKQITDMYSKFKTKYDDLSSAIEKKGKDKGKDYIEEINGYVDELVGMADTFGLKDELDEELKSFGGLDSFKSKLNEYLNGTRSSGEMAGDWFKDFGKGLGIGVASAATGFIGGAIGGGVAGGPVGAGAGAVAGGIVGIIVGIISTVTGVIGGSVRVDNQRKQNEQMAQNANEAYGQLIVAMTNASLAKKKQSEIEEYKRRKNAFI